ncbi:MAG: STAS domain-containing protein [Candidatus Omnitrophica bacterium]|nr:STAS domain-containing protein [Candidatus Omnitrophota bacterium]
MKVAQKEKNGVVICAIAGEINIDTVEGLKKVFQNLLENKIRKVLLNFDKVEYIDSLGIASLVELSRGLREIEGVLFLSNLSPNIRPIFSITKLDQVIIIYDTEEEALKEFYGY